MKPWINKFCYTFCGRGVEEHKPTSSLLRIVTSKGPSRSLPVFKAIGQDGEAGSRLIFPTSTYSLVQETKVNPDPPRIDQTHEDLVDWWDLRQVLSEPVWFCGESTALWTSWSAPSANHLLQTLCSCKPMHRAMVIASNPLWRKLNRLVCSAQRLRHQTIPVSCVQASS